MNKKIFWLVGIIAVCLIGIIVLTNVSNKSVDIDFAGQPFIGEASAPVEIVEFGDYKCPSCKNFNDRNFPVIYEEVIQTGKAKFYFMNYSFLAADSTTAAQFAETVYEELGNDPFWEFHNLLFANQTSETGQSTLFTEDTLEALLASVVTEEDTAKVMTAYREGKGKEPWNQDMNIAKGLGVSSTPTIYIDGKEFKGQTMDDFTKMVEEAAANGQ
ncbi:DsbA family protein [Sporosarcina sp. ACRSM]|uniref:DsbA family protein n=1 Tax=Sporosarcina sp. ACRSM TaxID=2918216 RepID=UPI001EF744A8|nr:DsbA family protein [Sporosarcina sp. ACRSM]MCG7335669.1 DsbA family protein [Sporosarcina sp. ACRSM]